MMDENYKLSAKEREELEHAENIKVQLKKSDIVSGIIKNLVLAILSIIWLIPIIWLVANAFSVYKGVNISHFFPEAYTLENFKVVITESDPDGIVMYRHWFINTLLIAIFSCIISTIFVLMVSYALSFCRFAGRRAYMNVAMVIGMFPSVLSMVIIYFVMKQIGLTGSHIGMVIVYSAGSGLGYLIIKGFMDTISMSIKEAAIIDGASEWKIFTGVILPLCKPIIVYQVISSFLAPWADFVFAKLMLGKDSTTWTVAIGLYNMLDKSRLSTNFAYFCAGGLLVSIPIGILFVIMQKYYVEGVTSGASKG